MRLHIRVWNRTEEPHPPRCNAPCEIGEPGKGGRIAERLLETLLAWARAHDFAEIYLDTLPAFKAAHRFYARHGFEELEKDDMPPDFPAMNWNARFFRRRL